MIINDAAITPGIEWPYYEEHLVQGKGPLWGDQYGLTMSQALFSAGKHDINTTFHAYIRKAPFNGSYLLTAGQNIVFEWMKNNWNFTEQMIAILRQEKVLDPQTGEMTRLYTDEFLDMLKDSQFELTIDAMPEGEIAFPDEPVYRVNGPVWQCLMVEGAILNAKNSQSLFATLASRLCYIANGQPVSELGLRRAQCIGGLEPTRGGYVGGLTSTSNMLAKEKYGIPSMGTMAHAFVMLFEDELEAFETYARHMPHNGVFLVDTYDTIEGVRKAIKACQERGIKLKGIRLDSGDLCGLSIEARKLLDEAGFPDSFIAASNDLDEKKIIELKKNGARIDVWGIGTNFVTSKDQPALGAVYKLGAVFDDKRTLSQEELDTLKKGVQSGLVSPDKLLDLVRETIKLSGDAVKITIPGELDVIRHLRQTDESNFVFNGDTIVSNLQLSPVQDEALIRDISSVKKRDPNDIKLFASGSAAYRPLVRQFEKGVFVGSNETIHHARIRAQDRLKMLGDNYRDLTCPQIYPVGLEDELFERRETKIQQARGLVPAAA